MGQGFAQSTLLQPIIDVKLKKSSTITELDQVS